jgi:hypothetical protein
MESSTDLNPGTESRDGSTIRHSLDERGVIVMKESRVITRLAATNGGALEVAGHIVVIVKNAVRRVSVGVKFEQADTTTYVGSAAFLDSDEIEEFLSAMTFVSSSASHMAHSPRDYTEVTYSTRDNLTVGFFQEVQKQQAFVRMGAGRSLMGLRIAELESIREAVIQARDHVAARRPAWEKA